MKYWFQNLKSLFSEKSLATRIQERKDQFKQKKKVKIDLFIFEFIKKYKLLFDDEN